MQLLICVPFPYHIFKVSRIGPLYGIKCDVSYTKVPAKSIVYRLPYAPTWAEPYRWLLSSNVTQERLLDSYKFMWTRRDCCCAPLLKVLKKMSAKLRGCGKGASALKRNRGHRAARGLEGRLVQRCMGRPMQVALLERRFLVNKYAWYALMISRMYKVILICWDAIQLLKSEIHPCLSAKFPGNDGIILFRRLWHYCKCHRFCYCNVSVCIKTKLLPLLCPLLPLFQYTSTGTVSLLYLIITIDIYGACEYMGRRDKEERCS